MEPTQHRPKSAVVDRAASSQLLLVMAVALLVAVLTIAAVSQVSGGLGVVIGMLVIGVAMVAVLTYIGRMLGDDADPGH